PPFIVTVDPIGMLRGSNGLIVRGSTSPAPSGTLIVYSEVTPALSPPLMPVPALVSKPPSTPIETSCFDVYVVNPSAECSPADTSAPPVRPNESFEPFENFIQSLIDPVPP